MFRNPWISSYLGNVKYSEEQGKTSKQIRENAVCVCLISHMYVCMCKCCLTGSPAAALGTLAISMQLVTQAILLFPKGHF